MIVPKPVAYPSLSREPAQEAVSPDFGLAFHTIVLPSRVCWYSPAKLSAAVAKKQRVRTIDWILTVGNKMRKRKVTVLEKRQQEGTLDPERCAVRRRSRAGERRRDVPSRSNPKIRARADYRLRPEY